MKIGPGIEKMIPRTLNRVVSQLILSIMTPNPGDILILRSTVKISSDQAHTILKMFGDELREWKIENPIVFLNPDWEVSQMPISQLRELMEQATEHEKNSTT